MIGAGPQLEALVLRRALSWRLIRDCTDDPESCPGIWEDEQGQRHHAAHETFVSRNIAAAWRVVEKMAAQCHRLEIVHCNNWPVGWDDKNQRVLDGPVWIVQNHTDEGLGEEWDKQFDVTANTAPLAICLAALKAVGVDEELKPHPRNCKSCGRSLPPYFERCECGTLYSKPEYQFNPEDA